MYWAAAEKLKQSESVITLYYVKASETRSTRKASSEHLGQLVGGIPPCGRYKSCYPLWKTLQKEKYLTGRIVKEE
jgi:hypothetical protein